MTISTFLTARGRRDPVKFDLPAGFDLNALQRAASEQLAEDVSGWLFFEEATEAEIAIDAGATPDETGSFRLHCHPCRRVRVTVNFCGDRVEIKRPPVAPLRVVLRRAIRKLGLDASVADEYLLTLPGSHDSLSLHTPIGSVTGAEDCELELDLVQEAKING